MIQFFQTLYSEVPPNAHARYRDVGPHGERLPGRTLRNGVGPRRNQLYHCRIYGSAVSPVVVYGTHRGVGTAHGIQSDLSRGSLPDGYLSGDDSGDRGGRGCLPALYVADAERL